MDSEIRAIMAQYMPLDSQNDQQVARQPMLNNDDDKRSSMAAEVGRAGAAPGGGTGEVPAERERALIHVAAPPASLKERIEEWWEQIGREQHQARREGKWGGGERAAEGGRAEGGRAEGGGAEGEAERERARRVTAYEVTEKKLVAVSQAAGRARRGRGGAKDVEMAESEQQGEGGEGGEGGGEGVGATGIVEEPAEGGGEMEEEVELEEVEVEEWEPQYLGMMDLAGAVILWVFANVSVHPCSGCCIRV
ncbi:unnamed protein product [Closterium sp. NIES-54]